MHTPRDDATASALPQALVGGRRLTSRIARNEGAVHFSKHNILTKIHGDERWLLANLLSGEADVLDPVAGVDAPDCRPVNELLSLGCSLNGREALG